MSRRASVISHLVVGPESHGVVRHGLGLFHAAREAGVGGFDHRLVRRTVELPVAEPSAQALLHVSFTDEIGRAHV